MLYTKTPAGRVSHSHPETFAIIVLDTHNIIYIYKVLHKNVSAMILPRIMFVFDFFFHKKFKALIEITIVF